MFCIGRKYFVIWMVLIIKLYNVDPFDFMLLFVMHEETY